MPMWQEHLSHLGTSPKAHTQPGRDSPLKHLPGGQAWNKPLEKQGCGEEGQISLDLWGASPGRARILSLRKAGMMAAFNRASEPLAAIWGFMAPSPHPPPSRQPVGDAAGAGGLRDARWG